MTELLTTHQAAQLSGVTINSIRHALKRGKIDGAFRDRLGHWLIPRTSIGADEDAVVAEQPDRMSWGEADEMGLVELYRTCSRAQVAEYYGVTESSIVRKVQELRKRGIEIPARKRGSVNVVPFLIPATGILLAKTCIRCDRWRTAKFYRRASRGWSATCAVCLRSDKREGYARRGKTWNKKDKALQEHTEKLATNRNTEWTSAELERVSDMRLSDLGAALDLGRTYYAVRHVRKSLGLIQDRKRIEDSGEWDMRLTVQLSELRSHYKALGEPVPEDLWEWNDTEEMAS